METPGSIIDDKYTLVKSLGKSASGEVWLAASKDGHYAIELFDTVEHTEEDNKGKSQAEYTLGNIAGVHPGIIKYIKTGLYRGPDFKGDIIDRYYIIEEFIEGYTLQDYDLLQYKPGDLIRSNGICNDKWSSARLTEVYT